MRRLAGRHDGRRRCYRAEIVKRGACETCGIDSIDSSAEDAIEVLAKL
jgi:hypothetical protein